MTVSLALIITLLLSVYATSTGLDLSSNSIILIILLIALISLANSQTALDENNQNNSSCCCRNRLISDSNSITQTLF